VTTNSNLGNYGANVALDSLCALQGLYLALHISDPYVLDPSSTEVAGGGYARQPIYLSVPSGRTIVSLNAQNYSGMPAATCTYLGVWTAVAAGFLVFSIDASASPIITASGGFVYVQPGDVALSF
jgi:hypothetical protein